MDEIEVRLYIVKGCVSAEQVLANIYHAAEKLGLQDRIAIWIHGVWSQQDADRDGFPGSPTITVEREDIDSDNAGEPCYGSRLYLEDGQFTSVPSVEMIKKALTRQRRAKHQNLECCM